MVHGIDRYRQARADVSPEKLVLLLLRESVSRLARLRELADTDPRWVTDLHQIRRILIELSDALDPDAAPELSGSLGQLYQFCISELVAAGSVRDTTKLATVQALLTQILEGWESVVATTHAGG